MLDYFVIFTKTGLVLWSKTFCELQGDPIGTLISSVLLEERAGGRSHATEDYTVRWTLANEVDLVFVAVYQKMFQLMYVDELLERVKKVHFASRPHLPPCRVRRGAHVVPLTTHRRS